MASRRYKVKKSAQVARKEEAKDFIENPDVLAEQLSKTEDFVQRNRNLVLGVLIAIIVGVGGYLGYRYYLQGQNEIAQKDMFQAIFYFEQDSLDKALNGDGLNFGMLQIIEDYGSTKAGNLARFYAGASYLKKGEFEAAIESGVPGSSKSFGYRIPLSNKLSCPVQEDRNSAASSRKGVPVSR